MLLKGLIETRTDEQVQKKMAWQRAALRIDIFCQRTLPPAYALCLAVLFAAGRRGPDP